MEIVVAGATGFVGTRLVETLARRGERVRAGSRRRRTFAGARWVELDVDRPETLPQALEGARVAVYLVHGMDGREGYAEREARAAEAFARASAQAGLERIIYLGGVVPESEASVHLSSRRRTGEGLRAGPVPVFELRAATILGAGSASWRILRDLALRLPLLVAPPWLHGLSEPVSLDDVVAAIVAACTVPVEQAGVYGLPGPEALDGLEMLQRICALRGRDPRVVPLPLLPKALAGVAVGLMTGCEPHLARELVQGMGPGLVSRDPPFWTLMPGHRLVGFDEMVRRAFVGEGPDWRLAPLAAEWLSWAASRKLAQ